MTSIFSNPIFILDALRTPIGSPYKNFKDLTAAQLAALAFQKLYSRQSFKKDLISEVILGNTVSAGTGQNLARQAALGAGLAETIPAYTVNNVCGAGLQAVILGAQSILAGAADIVLTGGAESATHCPYLIEREDMENQEAVNKKQPLDSLQHDGLFCQMTGKRMGELVERLAERHQISREKQDEYALESHQKAGEAKRQGQWSKEIISVPGSGKKMIEEDEHPRKNINLENLQILPAAFKQEGTVTAGNSSVPGDGAAAVLLSSAKILQKYKLTPRAKILSYASIATQPELTFEAAALAIEACLKKCRLSLKDIDLFEISEAFAAQAIYTREKSKIPAKKMNIWGGDIALGHPLGAAGARVLVTLMHALENQGLKRGLASICYGGGGAIAMVIEKLDSEQWKKA